MKCKNCRGKIEKDTYICPSCGTPNNSFRFGGANVFLLLLAFVQIGVLGVLGYFFFTGAFAVKHLENGNYSKAADMISGFGFIRDSDKVKDSTEDAVNSIVQSYIDESITYEEASSNVTLFRKIDSDSYSDMAEEALERIIKVREVREYKKSGDESLAQNDFEDAAAYYESISEDDPKYFPLKEQLIDSVYEKLAVELENIAKDNSDDPNMVVLRELALLKSGSKNQDYLKRLYEMENDYIYKEIRRNVDAGNFFGEEGVMELALAYDERTGSTDEVGNVYSYYVEYINQYSTDQYYRTALNKINGDFPFIESYSDYLNVDNFKGMRMYYAQSLLDVSRVNGKYTGPDGVIAVSKELNTYGINPSINIDDVIDEYCEKERQKVIAWLNEVRQAYGLSTMKDDDKIENAANNMITESGESNYDEIIFNNNMEYYDIDYEWASTVNLQGSPNAESFEAAIKEEGMDYSLLREEGLNRIGVGMKYHESNETISWFVIGIR